MLKLVLGGLALVGAVVDFIRLKPNKKFSQNQITRI